MYVYVRDLNSINIQYAARKYQDIGCIIVHAKKNEVFCFQIRDSWLVHVGNNTQRWIKRKMVTRSCETIDQQ